MRAERDPQKGQQSPGLPFRADLEQLRLQYQNAHYCDAVSWGFPDRRPVDWTRQQLLPEGLNPDGVAK